MELHQRRFRVGVRKRHFTKRVVEHQNRLPRGMVMVPSLLELRNIWTIL